MLKVIPREIKVDIIFFKTFPDSFLQYSDPKSVIKNIGHHARLEDITGSRYPLNPCKCTYQEHVYSFSSRYFSQE